MLPGLIGVVQATEAIKLVLGKGEPLIGRLLTYDALGMHFREVRLRRDPKCALCGDTPSIRDLGLHAATSEACAITPESPEGHAATGAPAKHGIR